MKYKVGQVVFFNWNNPFRYFIQFYNQIKFGEKGWSHTGIITKVNKDTVQIHEAISKGFVKSDYPKWFMEKKIKEEKITVREIQKQYTLKNVEENAEKYLGRNYAWIDIFFIVINFLTKFKFGGDSNSLICSEAVAKILYDSSEVNFSNEYELSYSLITPMHIYNSIYLR